ncbi:MAG TPA: hypothetical protein VMD77_04285 [Candidatus Baltobacteraceae bacterium]|nr:hypothetical protein [Candidatus Baltobacteraceae bacterium]
MLLAMRTIYRIVFLAVVVSATLPTSMAQSKSEPLPIGNCPRLSNLDDEQKFADFDVRIYRGGEDAFDGCVQIFKSKQLVFSKREEGRFAIGNDIDHGGNVPAIPIGTDITGRGKPDLILNEWSGGAHCCFTFHVVELSDHPREIASVQAEHSDYAHFEDLNHDGIYEFTGWDFTFAYWHAAFLQSPAPKIVLRFNGTRYELALSLMRQPPPSADQLATTEAKVRRDAWDDKFPPPLLWGTMLDLIYTGHSDLAWQFADTAWVPGNIGEPEFLKEFCRQLSSSPYFAQLRPTIQSAPCSFR